jgi:hypothetical protein
MADPRPNSDGPASARRSLEPRLEKLNPVSERWLEALPPNLRPRETARRFPHVVNLLATRWLSPPACREYFTELLLDTRGGRQGFPQDVASELFALKNYHETRVFPVPQTAWDELVWRVRR